MPPKLSIVTPSLNQGAFIERTIRSVLDQGYPNLEYVIVDGGSSDETVEIIKKYEDQLAWWVSEPDEGQTDAINKGIARTSGEIVAYINSDDYYLPGAFERAVEAFDQTGASWLGGAVLDLDPDGNPTELGIWRPQPAEYYSTVRPAPGLMPTRAMPRGRQWWLITPFFLPQSSVFWRRELFDRHGLFRRDMHYAFDGEFMVRLAIEGEIPAVLPDDALSVRIVHEQQKSASWDPFKEEIRRYEHLFVDRLTPSERRRLRVVQVLRAVGFYRAHDGVRKLASAVRHRVIRPLLRSARDVLGHVPSRPSKRS